MKRKIERNRARLLLWAAIAVLPVMTALPLQQTTQAIAQAPPPSLALPESLPEGTNLRVSGSSSMAIVGEALKQQFQQRFSTAQVTLQSSDSQAALEALKAGSVDIVATGKWVSAADQAAGLTPVVLEREKLAIIVSDANPFQGDIGYEQFAKIFRGEVADWSQLGGEAGPIRLLDRPESSDIRQALSSYPVFATAPFKAGATAQSLDEDNTALMVKNLGTDGIGYAPYSQIKDLPGVRVISMHQVLPDNPAYPYSLPRLLVYKGEPSPGVQAFLGVATGEAGQRAIAAAKAAEAVAVAQGQSPAGPVAIAPFNAANAVTNAATNAAGGDAAEPGAAEAAAADAGESAGAAAETAGEAAGEAAADPAEATKAALGDAGSNLPNSDALASRNLSPLWGILPLAAIAAGGGLLWWLAAGKEDDEDLDSQPPERVPLGIAGLFGRAQSPGDSAADTKARTPEDGAPPSP